MLYISYFIKAYNGYLIGENINLRFFIGMILLSIGLSIL